MPLIFLLTFLSPPTLHGRAFRPGTPGWGKSTGARQQALRIRSLSQRRRDFNVLSACIPVAVSRRVRRWPIFPKLSTLKSLPCKKTFPLHS